jgi:nitroimidazol reductase NimA-like FMN-containing flavoprotein (pyridoxamine 5'-phosphate oxidase superfamily)
MIKSSEAPSERTRAKRLHERGRWDSLRLINKQELKATKVQSMPIDEASAKIRTGQPVDDEEDYPLPI